MKIVWIDLNSSYAHSSLALPALHAQMSETSDIEWDIVSATINEAPGLVVESIANLQPDVVCGTLWLFNHEAMMHLLARVKSLLPRIVIALGGPEFLGDNARFLQCHRYIDFVFRGEGEEVFPQWIDLLKTAPIGNDAYQSISGLCYLDTQGSYHDGGKAIVTNFEGLKAPEESSFFNWSKPFVQLETTRGCFNTCAFCVSGGEKPVRNLSIEQIRHRLQLIDKHGIKNIRVLDRTFNYNSHRAQALLELFEEFPHIHFHLEIHPALLTTKLKEQLAQLPTGLLHLEAGIQSLSQKVLTASQRAGKLEDALEGLKFLCALPNMETHADLIAGLPYYRLEQIFADITTLAAYHAGEIQLESLKLLPGTEMRRRAEELGICYSPLPPYEVLRTRDISTSELQTARLLSRLLDGFYNTPAWQSLTRALMLEDTDFLTHFLDYLTHANLIDQPMALEKRGLLLYDYCHTHYPHHQTDATIAWIEAGMSLKKRPAASVRTKHITPPDNWQIVYGNYKPDLRIACLIGAQGEEHWFGYESDSQRLAPVFRAVSLHSATHQS